MRPVLLSTGLEASLAGRGIAGIGAVSGSVSAGRSCPHAHVQPEQRQTGVLHRADPRTSQRSSRLRAQAVSEPRAAARSRLQGLLEKLAENNEEQLIFREFEEAAPEFKVLLSIASGGVVTALALLLCNISHSDPLGGLKLLSPDSWSSAAVGLAVGVPLAGLRTFMWTNLAKRTFPVLAAVKEAELQNLRPFLSDLNPLQVAAVAAADVVPAVFLLLPAAQGGLTLSFGVYASMLHAQLMGVTELLPLAHTDELPAILAIALTSFLCAMGHYAETATSGEEYEVVENAIKSADRYYRVLSMEPASSLGSAEQMASAFKSVANAWIQQQKAAGIFHAVAKAVDVVILCVLWKATGNLAAPLVAALLAESSDVAAAYRQTRHGVHKLR